MAEYALCDCHEYGGGSIGADNRIKQPSGIACGLTKQTVFNRQFRSYGKQKIESADRIKRERLCIHQDRLPWMPRDMENRV